MIKGRRVAQFGSAPALGAGGRRFKSYLSDHDLSPIAQKIIMSSTKFRKNKRIKFGLFKTESDARAEIQRREKAMPNLAEASFRVLKLDRGKEGKRSWLAYALVRKKGM